MARNVPKDVSLTPHDREATEDVCCLFASDAEHLEPRRRPSRPHVAHDPTSARTSVRADGWVRVSAPGFANQRSADSSSSWRGQRTDPESAPAVTTTPAPSTSAEYVIRGPRFTPLPNSNPRTASHQGWQGCSGLRPHGSISGSHGSRVEPGPRQEAQAGSHSFSSTTSRS